jgi:hypothetical protein
MTGSTAVLADAQITQLCDHRGLGRHFLAIVPNGGSRVKNSETLLTKGDLPRPGGRNSRIPAIFAEHRPGPALLRTGNGYRLPASGGRVAAGEHFRVTGCRESR